MREGEGAEKSLARLASFFESDMGDFAGSGMNLDEIIAVDFFLKDSPDFFNLRELLDGCGSDHPILQPPVGAFYFPLSLGERA